MCPASNCSKACCTSWSIVNDFLLPESCSAIMMSDFPMGYFRDVWKYSDFARGMRKSEGDQQNKAGGLIVDLGWVATGCVSFVVLSSNIGSEADPKDDGPGRLLSWDVFWGESGMTITSVHPTSHWSSFFEGWLWLTSGEVMISSFRLNYVHLPKRPCGS